MFLYTCGYVRSWKHVFYYWGNFILHLWNPEIAKTLHEKKKRLTPMFSNIDDTHPHIFKSWAYAPLYVCVFKGTCAQELKTSWKHRKLMSFFLRGLSAISVFYKSSVCNFSFIIYILIAYQQFMAVLTICRLLVLIYFFPFYNFLNK